MSLLIINGHVAHVDEQRFTAFHGHSVFTTLRSSQGALVMWPEHWSRFVKHAKFFDYPCPREQDVQRHIAPHIAGDDKKLRLIATSSAYAITIEPFVKPSPMIYQGVEVVLSSWQPHPVLGRYKTGNSLPYLLAHKQAVQQGAFEALLTNADGFVVDGSRTSLLHFDGTTMTALDGGLDGCMRHVVMKNLAENGLRTTTGFMRPEEISGQLLLANSLLGVVPVLPLKHDIMLDIVRRYRMDQELDPLFFSSSRADFP